MTGLRMCNRQGMLLLTWHPPDRWRMDITTPLERFTVRSATGGSEICRRSEGGKRACRPVSEGEAMDSTGFGSLFETPEHILDAIGAKDVSTLEGRRSAGLPVECFAATGPDVHAEWCYSSGGVLVSFLRGSGAVGWTSLEASTGS